MLANTLAQFSRAQPSTGGFITFVGKTFGGISAVTTALLGGAGYIIAISSVLVISGGFLSGAGRLDRGRRVIRTGPT
jgi:amino acid transporter